MSKVSHHKNVSCQGPEGSRTILYMHPLERSARGLGKSVRYIVSSLYRKPSFTQFLGKQAKWSLYQGIVKD